MIRSFKKVHPIKQAILITWLFFFGFGIAFSIVYFFENGIAQSLENITGNQATLISVSIFFLLFIIRNIFFIPLTLLVISAPLIFGGLWQGIFFAGIGQILGASTGFLLARYYGQEFLETKESKILQIINQKLEQYGVISILFLRFIPVFPFDFINFGAGISKMRFSDFFWATALSVWPDCILFGTLGGAIQNPLSLLYTLSLIVILSASFWYLKDHPEYRELFIMKLKKSASRTSRKLKNIIRRKNRNRKKRW